MTTNYVEFKKSILGAVNDQKLFTFTCPFLIKHILREARLYYYFRRMHKWNSAITLT